MERRIREEGKNGKLQFLWFCIRGRGAFVFLPFDLPNAQGPKKPRDGLRCCVVLLERTNVRFLLACAHLLCYGSFSAL